ncbi:hypothetical protein D3C80_1924450 [compost metagenome]
MHQVAVQTEHGEDAQARQEHADQQADQGDTALPATHHSPPPTFTSPPSAGSLTERVSGWETAPSVLRSLSPVLPTNAETFAQPLTCTGRLIWAVSLIW